MYLQEFKKHLAKYDMGLKPILFSTQMVKAIINGTKTQTRREVKPQLPKTTYRYDGICLEDANKHWMELIKPKGRELELYHGPIKCPYGKVGDILWVRESCQKLILIAPKPNKYVYAADVCNPKFDKPSAGWRPSIHMPFEAARLFLRIKSIRIERLKDISSSDAVAEGIEKTKHFESKEFIYKDYLYYTDSKHKTLHGFYVMPANSFESLWRSINGDNLWDANQWVWVVEFEKISLSDIQIFMYEHRTK